MINQFVLANVLHRPLRALVSVLAISLEVLMILMVVGICKGMIIDTAQRQNGIGADIFLRPPNAPVIFSTGSVRMPIEDGANLKVLPQIRALSPVLTQLETSDGLVNIFGIDYASFTSVSGGFTFFAGGSFSHAAANEIIIDDLYQQSKRLNVGDSHTLKGRSFKVCGVVRNGKGARVFVPIETLQELTGWNGQATMTLIKLNDSSQVDAAIQAIQNVLPGYQVNSSQEWVSLLMNTSPPGLDLFIYVVVGIAVVIGSFAIFLSMYTTIAERTRDIGILKSLGASKGYIVNLILRESVALSFFGLLLGVVLTLASRSVIETLIPTQQVLLSIPWIGISTLLVVVSGVTGALYPAIQAASKDPLLALEYE
ncbi:MAG: ABC transporter permease [Acidobacteria bacterium]|nr:ABC transporter permease [Acidobacteriota bacterium]